MCRCRKWTNIAREVRRLEVYKIPLIHVAVFLFCNSIMCALIVKFMMGFRK